MLERLDLFQLDSLFPLSDDFRLKHISGRTLADIKPSLDFSTVTDIGQLTALLDPIPFRITPTEDGGTQGFAVLGGNKETGEVVVLAAIQNGSGPRHRHQGPERCHVLKGTLDLNWGQEMLFSAPNEYDMPDQSVHQPASPNGLVIVVYHQERGSTIEPLPETPAVPSA
ncbi:MAG: hypothetical protein HY341_02480 [Candidatus Kerfeldbacteria bacterium]|nr:hypothetical protein [Candidatus Kerfeldbacteria bacterium]